MGKLQTYKKGPHENPLSPHRIFITPLELPFPFTLQYLHIPLEKTYFLWEIWKSYENPLSPIEIGESPRMDLQTIYPRTRFSLH